MFPRRLLTTPFLWLWLLSIPASTVGVPIYEVYCFCLKQASVNFFGVADPCRTREEDKKDTCCSGKASACPMAAPAKTPSCCAFPTQQQEPHSCTKTTLTVHQLDVEYLVEGVSVLEWGWEAPAQWDQPLPAIALPRFGQAPLPAPPQPPPPLSGRELCVRHQLFLC
ncbi:MAG: hypothetical protein SFV52_10090 [Saprospiraceae bacterium]|nr:hypothetical protein [Saprospiraceae bacterium]